MSSLCLEHEGLCVQFTAALDKEHWVLLDKCVLMFTSIRAIHLAYTINFHNEFDSGELFLYTLAEHSTICVIP